MRLLTRTICVGLLALISVQNAITQNHNRQLSIEFKKNEENAIAWLENQITPNSIVPNPFPQRRRLILSYAHSPNTPAYKWIFSRSFIYDNALAVIAFSMTERWEKAEQILDAMWRNIRPDGSFWFSVNTHNSWPSESENEGALTRSGASAWAGYSIVFYLQLRQNENPYILEDDFFARDMLVMAEHIAMHLLELQVTNPEDPRYGLVTGGNNTYVLSAQNGQELSETFSSGAVTWASMEHNIDCYFFFRDLYRLTGTDKYLKAAELIKANMHSFWSPADQMLYRGIRPAYIDKSLPLDGASWGSIYYSAIGDGLKARISLETAVKNFAVQKGRIFGFSPYGNEPVFETAAVNGYFYPEKPDTVWNDLKIIWGEGSLGVAAAYAKTGLFERAEQILRGMEALELDGGYRYTDVEVPYQFSTSPSVASTAWYVLVCEMLKRSPGGELFWNAD